MRVVYSESMNAPAQGLSPSAAKPAAVMAAWQAQWPGLQVRPPVPVGRADFCRAHDADFVDGVLSLRLPNGFGTRSADVVASLPLTSGALLTAARWALAQGGAVAAPVSGFHHAGWDEAQGFCTFNGLMVTALALRAERPGLRVGILDYDYHLGDGTEDILERVGREGIVHITAGAHWREGCDARAFLENPGRFRRQFDSPFAELNPRPQFKQSHPQRPRKLRLSRQRSGAISPCSCRHRAAPRYASNRWCPDPKESQSETRAL